MKELGDLAEELRTHSTNLSFNELVKVCILLFGPPGQNSGSHKVFHMPWHGDPRINIQAGKTGKAKSYQIKQVIAAIEKLEQAYRDNS
ncbi:toxin HicA [Obesumbacterium proteus]|uniref:toxin HicA n=1 Tax=Obesumbacterium proteus TaxID=82983 RepID=UPI001F3125E5|nr:toxin HicA [Obesumbacterium proteus]MCE9886913.1 toxin HicA [Obesumbacterium proteus]MCE9916506.1 toxin HicA [Obesumbacterium proteus]MCE9931238.1 toxin HicA [Obesumbacterium proteus]MCG2877787.1 toxin HicA [Obesumbacterium proteus]